MNEYNKIFSILNENKDYIKRISEFQHSIIHQHIKVISDDISYYKRLLLERNIKIEERKVYEEILTGLTATLLVDTFILMETLDKDKVLDRLKYYISLD